MSFLEKIPTHVKEEITLWYRLTLLSTIVVLASATLYAFCTYRKLTKLSKQHTALSAFSCNYCDSDPAILSKKNEREAVLGFHRLVELLPDSITLSLFSYKSGHVELKGYAPTIEVITAYTNTLLNRKICSQTTLSKVTHYTDKLIFQLDLVCA